MNRWLVLAKNLSFFEGGEAKNRIQVGIKANYFVSWKRLTNPSRLIPKSFRLFFAFFKEQRLGWWHSDKHSATEKCFRHQTRFPFFKKRNPFHQDTHRPIYTKSTSPPPPLSSRSKTHTHKLRNKQSNTRIQNSTDFPLWSWSFKRGSERARQLSASAHTYHVHKRRTDGMLQSNT